MQRKVPNKLVIKVSPNLKTEKKPSSQINHDNNTKGPDLATKMKIRRSSDVPSPNYMKSTRCSEARKEKKQVPKKEISSTTIKSVNICPTATCSSTLKDRKSPSFLDLNPGGTESQGASIVKVCSYSHCSLNQHKHDSSSPFKSFLSAKGKELKTQRIMKPAAHNESGEAFTPLFDEGNPNTFVEIYVKESKDYEVEKESILVDMGISKAGNECQYDGGNFDWENDTSITALDDLFGECSDVDLEEGRLYLPGLEVDDDISSPSDQESDGTFVHPSGNEILCLLGEEGAKKGEVGIKEFLEEDSDEISRDEITDCYLQFSDSEYSVNDADEKTEYDQFLQDYGCSDNVKTEELTDLNKTPEASDTEDEINTDTPTISDESSINDVTSGETTAEQPPSFGDSEDINVSDQVHNTSLKESTIYKSLKSTIGTRKRGESSEAMKPFNPREPNYLEVEPGPEAEKVDLRHQEMDERRNAEEWMLDYALRNKVNQLAPARRKVALLVEAFETVIPPAHNVKRV